MRFWKRRRSEEDFRAEIDAHIEHEVHDLVRQRGLAPDVARTAARRHFGNLTSATERYYESRRWGWLEAMLRHLRHALQAMRHNPGLAIAVSATLAVGVGLNASLFTLLYAFLLRPLPLRDADRLVSIRQVSECDVNPCAYGRSANGSPEYLSFEEFTAFATHAPALTGATAYRQMAFSVPGAPGGVARGTVASCDYFQVLLVQPALGRLFAPDDCAAPGTAPVAVLSYETWRARFGSDSAVIGRRILVNALDVTLIGVTEPGFGGTEARASEMWLPLTMHPALAHGRDRSLFQRNLGWLMMIGRVASDASDSQLRSELAAAARTIAEPYPGRVMRVITWPAAQNEELARGKDDVQRSILFVELLALTILGMACANVINLLLARGFARRREIGVRLAIGAGRRQLVHQLVIESVVYAIPGSLGGLALVFALPRAVRAVYQLEGRQVDLSPDWRVLAYSLSAALLAALVAGLVPALQSTRVDVISAVKGHINLGGQSIRPSRFRAVVVGAQVAGCVLLLTIGGLYFRAAQRASAIDLGFDPRHLETISFKLSQVGYDTARARVFYDVLAERIAAALGVDGVALASRLPMLGLNSGPAVLGPDATWGTSRPFVVSRSVVTPSFFRTMRIAIVGGRAFTANDLHDGDAPAVVSRNFAESAWAGLDPIGRRFTVDGRSFFVTGVASETSNIGLGRTMYPTAYLGLPAELDTRVVFRTGDAPAALLAAVQGWAAELEPRAGIRVDAYESLVADILRPTRMVANATAALGVVALVLAALGIAGIVGFAVTQRRQEVAIRLALGSTGAGVVALVMRQGAWAVGGGIAVGMLLAVAATRVAGALLFGLSPYDPVTYALVGVLLGVVAFAAAWLPSRRAASIDPVTALRIEP